MKRVVVGVSGGIASGKSTFTKQLVECGAAVIDADKIAAGVLIQKPILDQIAFRWMKRGKIFWDTAQLGITAFGDKDRFRAAVARIVFQEPEELKFLEAIMHPLVQAEILGTLDKYHKVYGGVVLLDIPLLFEGGYQMYCNELAYISTPPETRLRAFIERYMNRRHNSLPVLDVEGLKKDFEARESRQLPCDLKMNMTLRSEGRVFKNPYDGTSVFQQQVREYWTYLHGLASGI